jgi:hypothetical protein
VSTKKKHYLTEVVPAGPKAAKQAERVRTRLLNQVDEKRSPRTRPTVNQLMDRYMQVLDIELTPRHTYEGPHPAAAWGAGGGPAGR